MKSEHALDDHIHSMLAHLHSAEFSETPSSAKGHTPRSFVTISRQAWAGGMTLAQALVKRLNDVSGAPLPWTCWDRELVEKVAADYHLSRALIESLEEGDHAWLADFIGGLSFCGDTSRPEELTIFRRVAQTIRGLASVGHVVIVGRGGVHITQGLPRGVHLRLVAPLEYRTDQLARGLTISSKAATEQINRIDRNREAFYRRYWPNQPVVPELFTVTLNAAMLDEEQMIACLTPLILGNQKRPESTLHSGRLPRNVGGDLQ